MKLLNHNKAALYVIENGGSITRAGIGKWSKEIPLPSFFHEQNGKLLVDVESPEFMRRVNNPGAQKKRDVIKNAIKQTSIKPPEEKEEPEEKSQPIVHTNNPALFELEQQAQIASLQDTIYAAKIKEEKSKQEEIKTAELKKDLAPMYLVKHFFTFAENMIQLIYTRPHEIMPEIKALILAGQEKQAEEKFIREVEGIVLQCQKDLIQAIRDEGYKHE